MRAECPKCGSPQARYQKTEYDLILVCTCGMRKVVFTTLIDTIEGPLCENNDAGPDVKLPRFKSNLHKTLMVLSVIPEGTSKEITDRLNELNGKLSVLEEDWLTVSDVSSYLTILRSKGLVERVDIRRGVAGGSTWELTDAAEDLLNK